MSYRISSHALERFCTRSNHPQIHSRNLMGVIKCLLHSSNIVKTTNSEAFREIVFDDAEGERTVLYAVTAGCQSRGIQCDEIVVTFLTHDQYHEDKSSHHEFIDIDWWK